MENSPGELQAGVIAAGPKVVGARIRAQVRWNSGCSTEEQGRSTKDAQAGHDDPASGVLSSSKISRTSGVQESSVFL
jgi:hypothetical protein